MTPQYVEMLLRGMLFGNHVQGMELFTVMMDSDPEIASCVQEYTDAVLKKRLVIEPYHEDDEEPTDTAIEKAKVCSAALRNMRPAADLNENGLDGTVRDIAFARFHGTSVLEADWTTLDGERFMKGVPGVTGQVQCVRSTYWVHPVCYGWDVNGRMGITVTQDSLKKTSDAAWGSKPSATGSAVNPRAQYVQPFPQDNFIIAVGNGKTGSIYGKSCLRALAWWWIASNFCGDYLMKYAELFGIPLRKATYDPNTPAHIKAEIRQILQSAGSEPWTMMPKGAEVEFERGSGGAGDSPQAFLFRFANEMKRKVILHQTMSGGAGSAGTGIGKGGMETEDAGPKADCVDAGAKAVCEVFNLQLIPSILTLNYGDGGDMEAPVAKLVDYEEGNYNDAQRDQLLSQIIDLPDSWVRRKYSVPKLGTGDKVAGVETGSAGAKQQFQQQQYSDQQDMQQQQMDMQQQQYEQQSEQPDEEEGQPTQARRALSAKQSAALKKAVSPYVAKLQALNKIKGKDARVAAYRKFLAEEPALRKQLRQHIGAVAEETAAVALPEFRKGLKL